MKRISSLTHLMETGSVMFKAGSNTTIRRYMAYMTYIKLCSLRGRKATDKFTDYYYSDKYRGPVMFISLDEIKYRSGCFQQIDYSLSKEKSHPILYTASFASL